MNGKQKNRAKALIEGVKNAIKTKKDLLDLKVLGIWIGIDVYETYLRKWSRPTVEINDPRLHDLMFKAIKILVFWNDYLDKHYVKAVGLSHDVYIDENILAKLAYQRKIPKKP